MMGRIGAFSAIVTLARKILAISHHLLTNMEPYAEPGVLVIGIAEKVDRIMIGEEGDISS